MKEDRSKKYMDSYLAGTLLGLLLILSFYLTREGLGASGGVKALVAGTVKLLAPEHAENALFYKGYFSTHDHVFTSRLFVMTVGVLIGGFISGIFAGRFKIKVEHSPAITSKKRIIYAVIGGFLFGIGSQFGRGCTSGAALSGMVSLSTAGFLAMIFIFGTGYAVAWFFRKIWIK